MRTLGRLRAERYRFWSTPSVITSADAMPILLNFCARSLVLGASMSKLSTTFSRSSRASCDRIEHIPARYILRFSFCEKFSSGKFGKILPPPRHSGLATSPARAPPVPFWRQGFLCEWRTSLRPFCARVPRRALALSAVTTWCTSDSLYSRPNNASEAATVAALFPFSLMSLSSITPPWPPAGQVAPLWPLGQPRVRTWPTEPPRARPSTALPWATDPWPESLWRWVERRCRGRGFPARSLLRGEVAARRRRAPPQGPGRCVARRPDGRPCVFPETRGPDPAPSRSSPVCYARSSCRGSRGSRKNGGA